MELSSPRREARKREFACSAATRATTLDTTSTLWRDCDVSDKTITLRRDGRERLIAYGALCAVFALICLRHGVGVRAFWDDAYIFLRYARNCVDGSLLAWNPGGAPTDGITSPLWLLCCVVATGAADALGRETETLLKLIGLACAGGWIVAMYRMERAIWPAGNRLWHALLIAVIALLDTSFSAAARCGMEALPTTALVALSITLFLRVESLAARQASTRELWSASLLAGLVAFACVLARPELALYALLATGLLTWKHKSDALLNPLMITLWLVIACGAAYAINKFAIYGDVIPLPAHVKSGLGADVYEDYNPATVKELKGLFLDFVIHYSPLLIVAIGALCLRRTREGFAWLWAPLALLIVYWATTLPIMGYHLRYYQPLIPMLVALMWAVAREFDSPLKSRSARILLGATLASVLCVATVRDVRDLVNYRAGNDTTGRFIPTAERTVVQRFLAQAPPGVSIAATEVGYLGYLCSKATIIDLSGLNDVEFSRGFDADALFARRPDAICLVHPDYQGMTRAIREHAEFAQFVPVFSAGNSENIDLTATVHVDTRSEHYAALRALPSTK